MVDALLNKLTPLNAGILAALVGVFGWFAVDYIDLRSDVHKLTLRADRSEGASDTRATAVNQFYMRLEDKMEGFDRRIDARVGKIGDALLELVISCGCRAGE